MVNASSITASGMFVIDNHGTLAGITAAPPTTNPVGYHAVNYPLGRNCYEIQAIGDGDLHFLTVEGDEITKTVTANEIIRVRVKYVFADSTTTAWGFTQDKVILCNYLTNGMGCAPAPMLSGA